MGNQTKFGTCYVTNQPFLNLFGLDWIELFGLWSIPLSSMCHKVQEDHSEPIQQYKKAFPKVFANSLGHCTKSGVKLFLKPDARPVFKHKRQVSLMSIPKVEEELDRLENLGIISPVDFSQWAAPIVVVKQAGGKPHNYPLPVPGDIFTKLNGSKVFSIIDLYDAYLQVEVGDESKKLLTINNHRRLYRFNRLASGVKSAPGAFQQLMNGMIANLEGVETFLGASSFSARPNSTITNDSEHSSTGSASMGSVFVKTNATFSSGESSIWAILLTKKVYAQILRRLKPSPGCQHQQTSHLSAPFMVRRPLDALLKKDVKFIWSQEFQPAFEKFKTTLQSDLLLTHYDPSMDIIVAADASKSGIGAVIMHRFPYGSLKTIAHASRSR
ncbi:uncharacterized protein K02A2.6-like [Uranotaenia lowii]|uniref:uncharacterized protein K02A2.6-like n=1 Tax=Uranotaenia lowii TaxID=190385 RepID=UPI00247A691B|nr:uncharacterized protein K02A2.6-like [Uranotaenia lowii]